MKLGRKLLTLGLTVWFISTISIALAVFVASAKLSQDPFRTAWYSLWLGAGLALLISGLCTWVCTRGLIGSVQAIEEMSRNMAEGIFKERFAVLTHTEFDQINSNLNRLASSLRSKIHDLQDSNAKLRAILDASMSGIVIVDAEGQISAINRTAASILGRSADELVGLPFSMALSSSDLSSLVYKALYRNEAGHREIALAKADERIVDATAAPVLSSTDASKSDVSWVVLTLHDLTEIRRLESMRTDFVQNISHELRTPVTVVKGFAETLRDTPPKDAETVKEMADMIDKEATRLAQLVGGLLDLAKFESGAVVLSKTHVDPEDFLKGTISKLAPLLKQKEQTVTLDASIPEGVSLEADPALMDMVFTNLLENAIKYTDNGGTISLGVKFDAGGWLFWVKDNGPGISEKDLPRIFERFYRGAKDRSRSTGGSGLGLAIVKHSVALHGGRVWVESQLGHGATFFVWLP